MNLRFFSLILSYSIIYTNRNNNYYLYNILKNSINI